MVDCAESRRRLFSRAAVLSLLSSCCVAVAQEPTAEGDVNAAFQITGVVNADKVYVRSGAGETDYPVMRLDRGTQVTVLGSKFEWLKITPPPGAYCVIGKAFVERRGDGKIGRITDAANSVKIGSNLNAMKNKVVAKLDVGTDVQIIEEQDEFLKIVPPPGTVLYINKRFVDPVNTDAPPVPNPVPNDVAQPTDTTPKPNNPDAEGGTPSDVPLPTDTIAGNTGGPTTNPNDLTANTNGNAAGPATASVGSPEFAFDRLEADFTEASQKPLLEQPLDDLTRRYQALLDGKQLPASILQICEIRLANLKVRSTTVAQNRELEAARAAREAAIAPVRAEREELQQRVAETQIKAYAAVGTLRASTLAGLYRLTDPATGRTVVYVKTTDAATIALVGKFVGVTGEVATDARTNMKTITPTTAEAIDPATLTNGKATARLLPASMLPTN